MSPLTLLICLLILTAGALAAPVDVFVSTSGDDAWSGTLAAPNAGNTDGPFATLARARDEVRRLKAAGKLAQGATVHVRQGTYRLTEPVRLGAEDSGTPGAPVVWRAFEKEPATLAASLPVTGFGPWKGEILVADLKGTPLEKVAAPPALLRRTAADHGALPQRGPG